MDVHIRGNISHRATALAGRSRMSAEVLINQALREGFKSLEQRLEVSLISKEHQEQIKMQPELSHGDLGSLLQKSPDVIKYYRVWLLRRYFAVPHLQNVDDFELMRRYGLSLADVKNTRRQAGFYYKQGRNHLKHCELSFLERLGTKEEVRKAVLEEGVTVEEYLTRKKLPITRDWGEQLIAMKCGIQVQAGRSILWHAHRVSRSLPQESQEKTALALIDRSWVESRLLALRGVTCFARELKLNAGTLKKYLRLHLRIPTELLRRRPEWIKLTCAHCENKFMRPKAQIDCQLRQFPDRKEFFCDKSCKGKHDSRLFGNGRPKRRKG